MQSKNTKKATRNTIQRTKIMEYLKNHHSHPTAEEIFKEIKKDIPTITLATVYRNLHILADKGEILRLKINKEYHFDAETRMHFHFFCENKNKIIDIFPEQNNSLNKAIIKELEKEGLVLSQNQLQVVIFGKCKK